MDLRQKFTFNGHSSTDFGLHIDGSGVCNAPERDTDSLVIPGRNGALTVDNGRYSNATVEYAVGLHGDDTQPRIDAVREWLLTAVGYRRLEDTYHPDEYRQARYSGSVEWDINRLARCGEATLTFDCWPQRFLKSGEDVLTVASGGKLYNPTGCAALPLIRLTLTGDAKLNVGGVQMSVAGYTGPMWIDCDLQDAYYNNTNLNKYLTAPEFSVLRAGATQVSWSGGIAKCEVVPRWWRL